MNFYAEMAKYKNPYLAKIVVLYPEMAKYKNSYLAKIVVLYPKLAKLNVGKLGQNMDKRSQKSIKKAP
jgi:hypothetical protein